MELLNRKKTLTVFFLLTLTVVAASQNCQGKRYEFICTNSFIRRFLHGKETVYACIIGIKSTLGIPGRRDLRTAVLWRWVPMTSWCVNCRAVTVSNDDVVVCELPCYDGE